MNAKLGDHQAVLIATHQHIIYVHVNITQSVCKQNWYVFRYVWEIK